jgi:hypothetical protein
LAQNTKTGNLPKKTTRRIKHIQNGFEKGQNVTLQGLLMNKKLGFFGMKIGTPSGNPARDRHEM